MGADLITLFYTAVAAYGADNGLPVSYPNRKFDSPKQFTSQYIRVQALAASPSVVDVAGEARYRWLLQLSFYSRDDRGELEGLRHAERIRNEVFPIHSELVSNNYTFKVIKPFNSSPPIPMDGWFSTPVTGTVQTIH